MIRKLTLVLMCGALMGTTCSVPVIDCANPLDAAEQFGFTVALPAAYSCAFSATEFQLDPSAAALIAWEDQASSYSLFLTVFDPANGGTETLPEVDGLSYESQGTYDTPNGLTFTLTKGTSDAGDGGILYFATYTLTNGNYILQFMIGAEEDSAAVLAELKTIIDGTQESA